MLDYDKVVTCSRDPVIKVFDLTKGADTKSSLIAELVGHEMAVSAIGVNSDGFQIASGARDCTIRVWDVET